MPRYSLGIHHSLDLHLQLHLRLLIKCLAASRGMLFWSCLHELIGEDEVLVVIVVIVIVIIRYTEVRPSKLLL